MSGLIRIDHEPFIVSHGLNEMEYIESYLIEAYVKSSFYAHSEIPNFYDFIGLFEDAIDASFKKFFISDIFNFPLERHEITWEYVEEVLKRHKIEFVGIKGEHFNNCQSILFPEWEVD